VKTTAKKATSLLFILSGVAPLVFTLFLLFKEGSIHRRMKDKMNKETLQTIQLAERDVIWMDKHEIWVNNSMFDIHTKELKNGVYTFTGLYDEEETELVEKEQDISKGNQQEGKTLSLLIQQLQNCFFHPYTDGNIRLYKKTSYPDAQISGPVALFREILIPPPRHSSC
jgi:hypothetical protein